MFSGFKSLTSLPDNLSELNTEKVFVICQSKLNKNNYKIKY